MDIFNNTKNVQIENALAFLGLRLNYRLMIKKKLFPFFLCKCIVENLENLTPQGFNCNEVFTVC